MTSQAPQHDLKPNRAEAVEARVNGVFDLPAPNRVAGWAIDRADPDASVEVEVYNGGVLLGRARADRYRADLERGGIGTGRYGYAIDIDPPIAPGMAFALSARALTGDGVSGALRATGAAAPSEDPQRALLERTFAETSALRAEVDKLRRSIETRREPADIAEIAAALERIEVVQARLDGVAATSEPPDDPSVGPGLRLAVGIALAMSALALVLGLWSVFG